MDYIVRVLKLSETSPVWSWTIICAKTDIVIEKSTIAYRNSLDAKYSGEQRLKLLQSGISQAPSGQSNIP